MSKKYLLTTGYQPEKYFLVAEGTPTKKDIDKLIEGEGLSAIRTKWRMKNFQIRAKIQEAREDEEEFEWTETERIEYALAGEIEELITSVKAIKI